MDPARYERLVQELEALAHTSPGTLKRRVRLLVALGYAYVLLVLALLAGAAALVVWLLATIHGFALLKFVLPLLGLVVVIARSLRVRVDPPEGRALATGKAPALDARVEAIRSQLAAPHDDHVILTDAFNAAVMQVPRWGIFGFPRTYLVLGVPLMLCLTREQFDAVLAHEFAHLSGSHPKLGLWVYRMSRTWNQLLEQLEAKRSWGHRLFEWFIRWYQPRMQAYGFVMSRRDEYEADADAARVTSPETMGAALVGMEVGERALDEHFWRPVWRGAEETPAPPPAVWPAMGTVWRTPLAPELRTEWLGTALARRAGSDDTHPSLRERLAALGLAESDRSRLDSLPTLATLGAASAAEHYLGDLTREILSSFDEEWRSSVGERWRERHEQVRAQRDVLTRLHERERHEVLGPDDLWQRAGVHHELGEPQDAIRALEALVALAPSHAGGHFLLGVLRLAANDEKGIEHVSRAMSLTSEFALRGASVLRDYYARRGMEDEKRAMAQVVWRNGEELRLALEERQGVSKNDELLPILLTSEYLAKVRSAMADDERVARLWIARKATTHLPDYPMMVFLVEPIWWRGSWSGATAGLPNDVLTRVDVEGWVHLQVIELGMSTKWMVDRMSRIEGSLVFERT